MLKLFRIEFEHAEFLKLPMVEREFFVTLAHATDDLRHVFYLCVAAERGTKSTDQEERKLAVHQLLFGTRLIYSILHEGWKIIERSWNGKGIGMTWHDRLDDKAKEGLSYLNKYFNTKGNLCRTIRDYFGFHYLPDHLRGPLEAPWNRTDDFISGRYSANIFYSFAEEIRAVAMAQATLPTDAPKLWTAPASEDDLRNAVINLYESWKPLHHAFADFANCVLPQLANLLPSAVKTFSPERVTKFVDMQPVLLKRSYLHARQFEWADLAELIDAGRQQIISEHPGGFDDSHFSSPAIRLSREAMREFIFAVCMRDSSETGLSPCIS